ncbi:MAG: ATP-grasp domain-containing protein, partial [Steroidobacter sp.]
MRYLQSSSVVVEPAIWNDRNVDWAAAFDAVLIRSIWDYHRFYDDFLEWLASLEQIGVPTINSISLLRWNSNKRYLLQLPPLGVDIVPTQVMRAGELADALSAMSGRDLVIKPTVSAGAWSTVRGCAGSAALSSAVSLLPPDLEYMVQPFIPEIAQDGEWSLLFFDGLYSHAVCKRPRANDYRVQGEFGGSVEFVAPDDKTIAAAERAVAAVVSLGYTDIT